MIVPHKFDWNILKISYEKVESFMILILLIDTHPLFKILTDISSENDFNMIINNLVHKILLSFFLKAIVC